MAVAIESLASKPMGAAISCRTRSTIPFVDPFDGGSSRRPDRWAVVAWRTDGTTALNRGRLCAPTATTLQQAADES